MSNPAVGARYVAALVVGVVGAGTFAGVSHDGRGADAAADPEPIVEVPSPSVTASPTTATTPAEAAPPAKPAEPDPVPTRARLRSRGS